MAAESIQAKADRLLSAGSVRPYDDLLRAFTVDGDSGRYTVIVGGRTRVCTCPARGECSHLEAAITYVLAEGLRAQGKDSERIEWFEAALAARKARDAVGAEAVFERVTR